MVLITTAFNPEVVLARLESLEDHASVTPLLD